MLQRYIARELYPLIIDALRDASIDGLTRSLQEPVSHVGVLAGRVPPHTVP